MAGEEKNNINKRTVISPLDLRKNRVKVLYWAMFLLLSVLVFTTIFPLFWMLTGALKNSSEIFKMPPTLFPKEWLWGNFKDAFYSLNFGHYFINTIYIVLGSLAIQITVSSMAGYSISKLKPAYARVIFILFLGTLMVPHQAYMVPQYLNLKNVPLLNINILDTYWALWLPAAANAFNIFLFKSFFDSIKTELLEAARIDGASEIKIFTKIIIPLSKPVFGVVTIFSFTGIWNSFIWPKIVISTHTKQPIMVALYDFANKSTISWNIVLGAMFIACLPPLIAFMIFQKQILKGINMTGLKG